MAEREDWIYCGRCDGCGQIADDDEGTPWSYWLNLPARSAGAMLTGLVKPLPCPVCKGTGQLVESSIAEATHAD